MALNRMILKILINGGRIERLFVSFDIEIVYLNVLEMN